MSLRLSFFQTCHKLWIWFNGKWFNPSIQERRLSLQIICELLALGLPLRLRLVSLRMTLKGGCGHLKGISIKKQLWTSSFASKTCHLCFVNCSHCFFPSNASICPSRCGEGWVWPCEGVFNTNSDWRSSSESMNCFVVRASVSDREWDLLWLCSSACSKLREHSSARSLRVLKRGLRPV
jgi:hypothetical protein